MNAVSQLSSFAFKESLCWCGLEGVSKRLLSIPVYLTVAHKQLEVGSFECSGAGHLLGLRTLG